ncbi:MULTISPECIES: hypothetical protein [Pseudomonas]|uniref:Uncharacterized protein n=1 Tax=Pseudomonas rhizophila TaxID=2045200 RepID=A0ABN5JW33_9PSED|nr:MULTISPECIES: hypothetical protein [Pseudomonas]AVU77591.1 hypothetical protein CRX69_21330 [Pseudomonas rhizophila]QKJ35604.1 hypothetical protein HQ912_12590 [Pseudomonas sp. MPDS]
MNSDNGIESEATSSTPPTDTSGKPVDKNPEDSATPSSTQTKEQEAEELSRKIAEIERNVADGH